MSNKRASSTPVQAYSTPTKPLSDLTLTELPTPLTLSPSALFPNEPNGAAAKSRLKVNIKSYHAIAKWSWGTEVSDVCGICQSPYEGLCPGVKFPGDDAPVVWGECKHAFHLQCVSTWLGSKSTCPICRREWEFRNEEGEKKEGV